MRLNGFEWMALWCVNLALIAFAWHAVLHRSLFIGAAGLFFFRQLVFQLGLLFDFESSDSFSADWLWWSTLGLAMFAFGAMAGFRHSNLRRAEIREWRNSPLSDDLRGHSPLILYGIGAVSLLVGALVAISLGGNHLLQGFLDVTSSGVDSARFSDVRQSAIERTPIPPGYVMQFTAILLPAVLTVLIVRAAFLRRPIELRLLVLWVPIAAYLMTLFGNRKFVLEAALFLVLLIGGRTSPLPLHLRAARRTNVLVLVGFLSLFLLATAAQGRMDLRSPDQTAVAAADNLYNRVSGELATTNREAGRVLRPEAPVYGREWLQGLRTLKPGPESEQSLSSRLHEELFGNPRGNLPLDVWGSIWYNWGIGGLAILPLLLGFSFAKFDSYLVRRGRGLARVVILTYFAYRLSGLRDPFSFALEGPLALLLLLAAVRLSARVRSQGRFPGGVGVRAAW